MVTVHRAIPFSELSDERIEQVFQCASDVLDIPQNLELSVAFLSSEEMHRVNLEHRGKDKPTDVLSFRYSDTSAEIVLGADIVRQQADIYGHSVELEAAFLLIHGIVHVMGWDHERSDAEAEEQEQLERNILDQCGLAYAR